MIHIFILKLNKYDHLLLPLLRHFPLLLSWLPQLIHHTAISTEIRLLSLARIQSTILTEIRLISLAHLKFHHLRDLNVLLDL
jgi:hypothetical protein